MYKATKSYQVREIPEKASIFDTIDKSMDANPNAEVYQIIKDSLTPDRLTFITEYILMPSDLRKHFIEISIGKTKTNWVFNIFTDEQKKEHLDIAIEKKDNLTSIMLPYLTEEQKIILFEDKLKKGKGLKQSELEILTSEQLKQYVMIRIENHYCNEDDFSFDVFQKMDLETKLEYITHVGVFNLEKDIKEWYSNYRIGLKREKQIKLVIDES
jgi:hypothetical protein